MRLVITISIHLVKINHKFINLNLKSLTKVFISGKISIINK